jgi:uncharacterized protein (UPF0335 family)
MEIRTSEEARTNVESFAERYAELLVQKKTIDHDMKALKNEFKEEGVPVGVVCSVLNRIKALKKKTDSQIFEEDKIEDWLLANPKIAEAIALLTAKL